MTKQGAPQGITKHKAIQIELENKIRSEKYQVGTLLPPEDLLSTEFKVSRSTIRQALRSLEQKGLIKRKSGYGTTVMPMINTKIQDLSSFSEDMISRGYKPTSKLLEINLVDAPEYVKTAFVIKSKKVWYLKRLRFADGDLMALQHLYIPPYLPVQLQDLVAMDSYYNLLETKFNIKIHTATETLGARRAKNEEIELLQTTDAIIEFDRISYTNDAKCVEYVRGIYLSSRYKYQFNLIRNN